MTDREKKKLRLLRDKIDGLEREILNTLDEEAEGSTQDYLESLSNIYFDITKANSTCRLRLIRSKVEI